MKKGKSGSKEGKGGATVLTKGAFDDGPGAQGLHMALGAFCTDSRRQALTPGLSFGDP